MRKFFMPLIALALSSVPVPASDLEGLCDGTRSVAVGQWARYQTDVPLLKNKMEVRYAIVSADTADGKNHYWMEFDSAMPMGQGSMVIQILIPGWPYSADAVRRARALLPSAPGMDPMPPMEMPPNAMKRDNLSEPLLLACEAADEGVQESVTVPAGTFTATRIPLKSLGKEIWISSEVPFGVVKMVEPDGKGLVLVAYGTDAESSLDLG